MTATKQNQFWKLRSKHGRDTLFSNPQTLWQAACEYFQWCDDNPLYSSEMMKAGPLSGEFVSIPHARPYTIEGFCRYCGTGVNYLQNLKNTATPEMQEVIDMIQATIRQQKFEGAAVGLFNSAIISRDLGLKEYTPQNSTIHITVANNDEREIIEGL